MGEDGTDVTAAAPSGLRRLAPRSFRASIVASTVGVMTVAMIVVVLGTYLVLERSASRDIQQVLDDRSRAVLAVLEHVRGPRGRRRRTRCSRGWSSTTRPAGG